MKYVIQLGDDMSRGFTVGEIIEEHGYEEYTIYGISWTPEDGVEIGEQEVLGGGEEETTDSLSDAVQTAITYIFQEI